MSTYRDKALERRTQRAWWWKNRKKILEQGKAWREKNTTKVLAYKERCKWNAATMKMEVLGKLGGKCVECGITDKRVLCIDHVNGGGYRERVKISYQRLLRKVLDDADGKYQLLCHNCNWIKRSNNKVERGGYPVNARWKNDYHPGDFSFGPRGNRRAA